MADSATFCASRLVQCGHGLVSVESCGTTAPQTLQNPQDCWDPE